ncbi:unnamed protein product [Rotaria magnacalcarata]|nr:unnamed protein product [Rotaria magnacalcarata]
MIVLYHFPSSSIFNSSFEYIRNINKSTLDTVLNSLYDPWIEEQKKINVTYYYLANDSNYHYEFRYEFNVNQTTDDHRLMILTTGRGRTCIDYWRFPVGRRIVYAMRDAGFSLLAICSTRRLYETEEFILENREVKWIYKSLQRWINRVYHQRFQRYPVLYIHGASRGAAFAPLIARILPIRALILTVYPGHKSALTIRSSYSRNMQNRLLLDTTFANWFYFDYCYNSPLSLTKNLSLCPFENKVWHFYPTPPTYFVALDSDPSVPMKRYTELIKLMRNSSLQLGGQLLNQKESIMLDILSPVNFTPSYMQQNFDLWYNKPYASRIFFEHYNNLATHVTNDTKHGTCRCSKTNFTYWEGFPNITTTWSLQKQAEHKDYVRDIKAFRSMFCEELCGNIMVYHGIVSRNIGKALDWITKIDHLRHALLIQDYVSRPLRFWMYRKQSLNNGIENFSSEKIDWTVVGKQYRMYTVEYLVQDYFARFNVSKKVSRHDLIWIDNPMLADFFIVPHDLMYLYLRNKPEILNQTNNDALWQTLNEGYFKSFLANMRNRFPYWTMAKTTDQIGSNHIFTFVGRKNMGFLYAKHQKVLRNVIQLVFTGVRQNLLPPKSYLSYSHRDEATIYRHGYDIVIPQFTDLKLNESLFSIRNISSYNKKILFFFAANLSHTIALYSTSPRLTSLWRNFSIAGKFSKRTTIEGISYETLLMADDLAASDKYIDSMLRSVFSICPETFLPWSYRIYEAIQLGVIPVILADNVVLPFERFINWQSFSVKINVSNLHEIINRVNNITSFKRYIAQKLRYASSYSHIFRWPYTIGNRARYKKEILVANEYFNGNVPTVFRYISLEMRCRHLEQLYGFTSDISSPISIAAQQKACNNHPTICPCHSKWPSLAFQEYI